MDAQTLARMVVLAAQFAKQLDRLDIDVGIDDAAGEVGAGGGELHRAATNPRHHEGEHADVIGDP